MNDSFYSLMVATVTNDAQVAKVTNDVFSKRD